MYAAITVADVAAYRTLELMATRCQHLIGARRQAVFMQVEKRPFASCKRNDTIGDTRTS